MKTRNVLEVNATAALSAIALALATQSAWAAEAAAKPDGHAYVRASILNTWAPTAVASETEGKTDAHERARLTIVGASKSATGVAATNTAQTQKFDAHDQARRLLMAQPATGQSRLEAVNRSGS